MSINNGMRNWFGLFPSTSFEDDSCHIIGGMGNTGVIETEKGLVLFDLPIKQFERRLFTELRKITNKQVKYIIYSHGHFDHCFAFTPIITEIEENGWEMPQVIAHENCVKRFEKYRLLDKYHNWINKQQFASVTGGRIGAAVSPHETLEPTIILKGSESYTFNLGECKFELYHNKGETDDSIWLWVPKKKLICAGDLMMSSFPNVGNPYKVQRYPKDWAIAMEKMRAKKAKYIIPGHGPLIESSEHVEERLTITAEVMHFVHDEVVKRLNEGKWFEQIYHDMLEIYPEKFRNHPYLREVYGCYPFAIHATYRLYHGWYDTGNPTDLFPSKSVDVAKEFLKINSDDKYFNHANKLFSEGKLQLALHLLDIILKGSGNKQGKIYFDALSLKHKILKSKAKEETSFIATNIINNAATQIKEQISKLRSNIKNLD
ncbi:MAG: alkyl sulfatase dimerization domain-containing protein [Promethearchaeota archaeon]|jgi:alkyl sulfatase BDS1-like metallo-beta-lactamase superfamily hydrolase